MDPSLYYSGGLVKGEGITLLQESHKPHIECVSQLPKCGLVPVFQPDRRGGLKFGQGFDLRPVVLRKTCTLKLIQV